MCFKDAACVVCFLLPFSGSHESHQKGSGLQIFATYHKLSGTSKLGVQASLLTKKWKKDEPFYKGWKFQGSTWYDTSSMVTATTPLMIHLNLLQYDMILFDLVACNRYCSERRSAADLPFTRESWWCSWQITLLAYLHISLKLWVIINTAIQLKYISENNWFIIICSL